MPASVARSAYFLMVARSCIASSTARLSRFSSAAVSCGRQRRGI